MEQIELDGVRFDLADTSVLGVRKFTDEYVNDRREREDGIGYFIGTDFTKDVWADSNDCEQVCIYGVPTCVRVREIADSHLLWKQIMRKNESSIIRIFVYHLASAILCCLSDEDETVEMVGNVRVRAIREE